MGLLFIRRDQQETYIEILNELFNHSLKYFNWLLPNLVYIALKLSGKYLT